MVYGGIITNQNRRSTPNVDDILIIPFMPMFNRIGVVATKITAVGDAVGPCPLLEYAHLALGIEGDTDDTHYFELGSQFKRPFPAVLVQPHELWWVPQVKPETLMGIIDDVAWRKSVKLLPFAHDISKYSDKIVEEIVEELERLAR
ncbi:hypothetical protein HY492_04305 [Candidatus Woesearchaeota archaeon]|nr:hypothetical protein [Candidatus Woesearchaeota archaeon]